MNSKHFVYFALAIFGLACNDNESPCEGEPFLTMHFYDLNSNDPVVGADVVLMKDAGSGYSVIEHLTTDDNGKVWWECSLGAENIDACKEGYWGECGSGKPINSGDLTDHIYEMQPKAWLKVYVNDVEPYDPGINVRIYSYFDNTEGVLEATEHSYYDIIAVGGNSTEPLRLLKYLDTSDPPIYSEYINLVVPAGDTLVYTYNY